MAEKSDSIIVRWLKWVCALLMGIITATVFLQFAARYVFKSGIIWAEEVARYSAVWMTFLGAALALMFGSHAAIQVFIKKMPKGFQYLASILGHLAMIIFLVVIVVKGLGVVALTIADFSPGMKIPLGLVYLALPFSSVIMLIYLTGELYRLLKKGPESLLRG